MQVLEIRKQSINKLNFTTYRIIIIIIIMQVLEIRKQSINKLIKVMKRVSIINENRKKMLVNYSKVRSPF